MCDVIPKLIPNYTHQYISWRTYEVLLMCDICIYIYDMTYYPKVHPVVPDDDINNPSVDAAPHDHIGRRLLSPLQWMTWQSDEQKTQLLQQQQQHLTPDVFVVWHVTLPSTAATYCRSVSLQKKLYALSFSNNNNGD